jgi:hypothetical protein
MSAADKTEMFRFFVAFALQLLIVLFMQQRKRKWRFAMENRRGANITNAQPSLWAFGTFDYSQMKLSVENMYSSVMLGIIMFL